MKTVIDAVNEFKGGWENTEYGEIDVRFIFECFNNKDVTNSIGALVGDCENGSPENYREVCTRKQFSDLASQMETNFGKCDPVLAAYYRHVTDKELLTKSTKELDVDFTSKEFFQGKEGSPYSCLLIEKKTGFKIWMRDLPTTDGIFHWFNNNTDCYTISGYKLIVLPKPQPTQIYTQAMADNGELPSVGMMVETTVEFNGFDAGSVLKVYSHDVESNDNCVLAGSGKYQSGGVVAFEYHIKYLKPLTPPMTLIDGKAYQFDYRDIETCGVYSKDHNLLYSADSIIDISDCTNIQPLTVEVK